MLARRRFAPALAALAAAGATCLGLSAPALARQSAGCGPVRHYSGSGAASLGNLSLARDSTLSWTNDGYVFQVNSSAGMPVNSEAHSGTAMVGRGKLEHLSVTAIGSWKMRFTPLCPGKHAAAKAARRLSGTGSKEIGALTITRTSRITWTSAGDLFLFLARGGMIVNSTAHRGSTVLAPGTYQGVEVKAYGAWTIAITQV